MECVFIHLTLRSVGITGGIGSGKSMVCAILEKMGYPVFYADAAAKKVMHEDALLRSQITQLLGDEAYLGHALNRPFIAGKIFSDPKLRQEMDSIVHPAVYRAFDTWKNEQHADLIFNESALLFETGSWKRFDATVLVTADKEVRIARVMQRDQVTREQVLDRMAHQLPDEEKQKRCTLQIVNNPDQMLIPQVLEMIQDLKSLI